MRNTYDIYDTHGSPNYSRSRCPMSIVPGQWSACLWLSLSVLLSMSTWLVSSVMTDHLATKFHVSQGTASILGAGVQAGFMISSLLQTFTMLPDRINCRKLMAAGAFIAAPLNLLLFQVPSFPLALCCRFATGMCMALIYPPSTKLLSTWFIEGRGMAMAVLVGSISPGSAIPDLVKVTPPPLSSHSSPLPSHHSIQSHLTPSHPVLPHPTPTHTSPAQPCQA